MLQRRALFICIAVFIFIKPFAQVNLQTGSATFSLPMFSWNDDKSRLNSVIGLNYNSGNGLKVSDVASNVGQGWSLQAGGVITRLQVGEPDDQRAYGAVTEKDITKYPNGYLYAATPAANGCPNALTKYPIYGSMNQVYIQHNSIAEDKQLDYFSFQFNGKVGMFILDATGSDHGVSLGDSKMKITFQRDLTMANNTYDGIRTVITSFTIQDVDGLIYRFTTKGKNRVLQSNYCDDKLTQNQTQPKFDGGKVYHQAGFQNTQFINSWVINNWYLSEIEDPLTHRKIIFTYLTRSITNVAGIDFTYNQSDDYSIITHKTSITQTPEIYSISYPDGHVALFNYGGARIDYTGQNVLASVDFTYQGRYLSRYQVNTSYFILNRYGTPVSDYEKKVARLCLRSVQKIGVDLKEDTPPYTFDYYMGSNAADDFVPPPFSYAKDIWGFYNGNNSIGYNLASMPLTAPDDQLTNDQIKGLCFLRNNVSGISLNAKSGFAQNGLLKQIIYPTGGTLGYQYSQNTGVFLNETGTYTIGGVHVSQTSSTDGGYSNSCANPIITLYNYVLSGSTNSSLWGIERPVNSITNSNHYAPEWKSWHWKLSCVPFGCCYWHFQYPGILSQNQAVDLNSFQKFMNAVAPYLGVLSIVTTITDVVNLVCVSSGFMAWAAVVVDIIGGIITLGITCLHNYTQDKSATIFYNSDLNAVSPLPAQFKRVEVVENPGTIGKTVNEFTSSDDYPLWEPSNPNFSAKQRYASWAYGLPKFVTVYDADGNKIKQTENVYDFYSAGQTTIDYCSIGHGIPCNSSGLTTSLPNCKCVVIKSSSQRNTDWANPAIFNAAASYQLSSGSDMKVEFYGMYTGRTILTATYGRTFRPTDVTQYVENETDYTYNTTSNYDVNTIATTQSNGDINFQYITYSSDYTVGVLSTLVQNNIISLPVSTTNIVRKYNTGVDLGVNEEVKEFVQLANGDIKPSRLLEQRFNAPASGMTRYAGPGSPISNYKITKTFAYDAFGNLTGVKDEGSHNVANIYAYFDKYIVASVINADPNADKPAYTSFETSGISNPGGWTIGGIVSYNNSATPAVTGALTFALLSSNGNSITSGPLNLSKAYTLSFWSNNSNVTVTGGTLVKSAPVLNGYTYYEYDIAQGTASVVLKNAAATNANIDELRLYPKNARMRSVTYDPLIGKTSECDENNRITYYEYDNLGRLRFIKDEGKNITKVYEYNNVSAAKQNGCPATYYNHLVSEIFTRSNCAVGYLGGSVTYTIAANTYSSTLSQADADAKAENYLLANAQTYANTNGGCSVIYYNVAKSQTYTTQSCNEGYDGGTVTYTVPAARYSSIINQADADQKATIDITANGQAYANSHPACTISTVADWTWLEGAATYCQTVNGTLPAHLFVLETDLNPNSSTYNQTRWSDVGPQDNCPANLYYNAARSQSYYRNNCAAGYVGGSVTYTVAAGKYSSATSQAAADQLAINDIAANGQNYANTNGTCTQSCVFTSAPGFGLITSGISSSGGTVTFYIVFNSLSGTTSWSGTNTVANITGGCFPSVNRSFTMNDGSRVWQIDITTFGTFNVRLVSGPAPTGTTAIGLSGGSYSL